MRHVIFKAAIIFRARKIISSSYIGVPCNFPARRFFLSKIVDTRELRAPALCRSWCSITHSRYSAPYLTFSNLITKWTPPSLPHHWTGERAGSIFPNYYECGRWTVATGQGNESTGRVSPMFTGKLIPQIVLKHRIAVAIFTRLFFPAKRLNSKAP